MVTIGVDMGAKNVKVVFLQDREMIGKALVTAGSPVRVVSAQPLDGPERMRVEELLQALGDGGVELTFDTDPALIAGARVEFSSQAVDASLADVLDEVRERVGEQSDAPGEAQ